MVKTDAYEYKYIIKGKVEYTINNETYILEAEDSLFFDGRLDITWQTSAKRWRRYCGLFLYLADSFEV